MSDEKALAAWLVAFLCVATAVCGADSENSANSADALAAESLHHSAMSLVHAPIAHARAGRLVVLAGRADSLVPGTPRFKRLLAGIYETQGDLASARNALEMCLAAKPGDHRLGVGWLGLQLDTMEDAEGRAEFLSNLAKQVDRSSPLRAEAAAMLGQILLGRGRRSAALDMFDRALELDPHHPGALERRLALGDSPDVVQRVSVLTALLGGNPTAADAAWKLAALLGSQGMYDEALEYFHHVRALVADDGENPSEVDFLVQYANALLDAGRYRQAVETLTPLVRRFGDNADLRSLIAEAYRATNEPNQAEMQILALEKTYDRRRTSSVVSEELSLELAWFYLSARSQPKMAMLYARKAQRTGEADPVARRIIAAVKLATGQVEAGEKELRTLLGEDIYAAVFLGRHYWATGRPDAAKEAILAGAKLGRSGPAFRLLAATATQQNVTIPDIDNVLEVRAVLGKFDKTLLEMARTSGKFLSVVIRPTSETPAVAQPITLEATLTNTSDLPVPLGEWGVITPVAALEVTASEPNGEKTFTNLPLLIWPAPRYLQPGKTVRQTVRIDVGELETFLAQRPLEDITLRVKGIVDPVQRGDELASSASSLPVKTSTFTRVGLLGDFQRTNPIAWQDAWGQAVDRINHTGKSDLLSKRMLAARQAASLLAYVRRQELGKTRLPPPLAGFVSRGKVLPLFETFLADSSPVVRAEAMAALINIPLDIALLPPLVQRTEDPDPLVRMRTAELLGVCGGKGLTAILDHLAADSDKSVSDMAKALRK